MSIINEALKKAVREKEASYSSNNKNAIQRNLGIEFLPKKRRFNWGPVFVLLMLALISGPIVAPIFSTPLKGAHTANGTLNPPTTQNIPPDSTNRKSQFAVEEIALPVSVPPAVVFPKMPNLTLSGIVYSPNGSYCIINNLIVKVGDTVHGAKLLAVSQNSVRLDYQGKEMALSLNNA